MTDPGLGLCAQHLCGDCIRNGNVGDRAKFKTGFWKLQSSPTEAEYTVRFERFTRKWPTEVNHLEKQVEQGPCRLMDLNQQVDGVHVCTMGMKTNNVSVIQNSRVVHV